MDFTSELIDLVGDSYDEMQDPFYAGGECYNVTYEIQDLVNWDERMQVLYADHNNDVAGRHKRLQQCSDHYAVYLPGEDKVLDYTLRQFNPDTTFPFVGSVTEWLRVLQDSWETEDVKLKYNVDRLF